MSTRLDRWWYQQNRPLWWLGPLSGLYRGAGQLRSWPYRIGLRRAYRAPVPVLVVGNITVGGTGKTPLTAWLARELAAAGVRPGIVCRGYRGRSRHWPRDVQADDSATEVGDEALLLSRRSGVPVVAGPDRPKAMQQLLEAHHCEAILVDDGLQNPGFARDIECVVVDDERRFGNGAILPVGPLRESPRRLQEADVVVLQGTAADEQPGFVLAAQSVRSVSGDQVLAADALNGQTVHAVAGIGHPQRFFGSLAALGYRSIEHPFDDHYHYRQADFAKMCDGPILMTEKDAVKCQDLALTNAWYLAVDVQPNAALLAWRDELLERLSDGLETA